eukprot:310696_1
MVTFVNWLTQTIVYYLIHLVFIQCCYSGKNYYLIDQSIASNYTIPLYVNNNTIVYSIEEAWNNIIISLQQVLNGSNIINITDPNEFIFNINILSDINVIQSSNIILPSISNYDNHPITLNVNCMASYTCNINIKNGTRFINIMQQNSNATKLILSIHDLNINVFTGLFANPYFIRAVNIEQLDVLLNNVNIYGSFSYYAILIMYSVLHESNIFSLISVQISHFDTPVWVSNGGNIIMNDTQVSNCTAASFTNTIQAGLLFFDGIISYHVNNLHMLHNIHVYNNLIYFRMATINTPVVNYFSNSHFEDNHAAYSAIYLHGQFGNTNHIYTNIIIDELGYTQYSGIIIRYISNVWLINIYAYTSYETEDFVSAIALQYVQSAYMDGCNLVDWEIGSDSLAVNTLEIHNSTFEHSLFGIFSRYDETVVMDNVYIGNCSVGAKLISNHRVHVINALVQYNKNGMNVRGTDFLVIENSQFNDNSAGQVAGGLYLRVNNQSVIENTTFSNNKAPGAGGAIYIQLGKVEINNCWFTGNTAYKGGAIGITYQMGLTGGNNGIQLTSIKNSYFTSNVANTGGAIFNDRGEYTLFNNTFISNKAKSNGGAINDAMSVESCKLNISVTIDYYNKFINNGAYIGGAIYSTNCDFHILGDISDNETFPLFINNTAIMYGGAIVFDIPDFSTDLIQNVSIYNTIFENNIAQSIGGGAIALFGGNVQTSGCIFRDNHVNNVDGIGGAIMIQSSEGFGTGNSTCLYMKRCFLTSNYAQHGGAIAVKTLGNIDNEWIQYHDKVAEITDTTIIKNYALSGGGIYVNPGSILIRESIIENNYAFSYGGGMHLVLGAVRSFASIFSENWASLNGGGIMSETANFRMSNNNITNNSAGQYGGGVFIAKCPIYESSVIRLTNNSANVSGGGYFIGYDIGFNATCTWADFRDIQYNNALFGNNYASKSYDVRFVWDIPSRFTRSTTLNVAANLWDSFTQQVTKLGDNEQFILKIEYETVAEYKQEFKLFGDNVAEFDSNETELKFNVKPIENGSCSEKKVNIDIIFTAIVDLNGERYNSSKTVVFYNEIVEMWLGTIVISHLLNVINSICIIFAAIMMVKHKEQPIIKGSRVPFMYIILFGLEVISIAISHGAVEHHKAGCGIYIWLLMTGLVLTLSPISAKTWAIYNVFAYAENLKDFTWSSKRLFAAFVFTPFAISTIYMGVWTIFDKSMVNYYLYYDDERDYLAAYCPLNMYWSIIPFICVIISLIVLVVLAVKSRHVPENWNESKYLVLCIFTYIIIVSMFIPIVFFDYFDQNTKQILRALCGTVLIQCILTFLFYIKFGIVFSGGMIDNPELDRRHSEMVQEIEASSMKTRSKSKSTKNKNKNKPATPDGDKINHKLTYDIVSQNSDNILAPDDTIRSLPDNIFGHTSDENIDDSNPNLMPNAIRTNSGNYVKLTRNDSTQTIEDVITPLDDEQQLELQKLSVGLKNNEKEIENKKENDKEHSKNNNESINEVTEAPNDPEINTFESTGL